MVAAITERALPPSATALLDPVLIDTERAQRRLRHFIAQAWHVIEPGTPYVDNWHIHAIAEHLEAVDRREIRNLLINMPPRMLKSISTSIMFPAWVWTHRPEERFLYSSYSQQLATDHSLATRRVVESDWYQERWGDLFQLAGDANLKTRFENDRRGARISTSVGGAATGSGGSVVVVDDPHNVKEAESEAVRESTLLWWDRVMSSRLNDPKTGAKIIIMQRVHENDLAGHVLAQGGYVHLNLPMEYDPKTVVYTGFGRPDPRTKDGELLAPARIGSTEVADLKVRLGSYAYAGQYQQRPAPAEGGIFKYTWWQYCRGKPPELDWLLTAWDTAFKKGEDNDYSVGLTLGGLGGDIYVIDCWREKVEFPALKRAVPNQYLLHLPDEIVVEDKASGQSLIQEMKQPVTLPRAWDADRMLPIIAYNPGTSDKEARAHAVTPYVEAGRVYLPHPDDAAWVDAFIAELGSFPLGQHDDQVDAFVIGMLRLTKRMKTLRPGANIAAGFDGLPG